MTGVSQRSLRTMCVLNLKQLTELVAIQQPMYPLRAGLRPCSRREAMSRGRIPEHAGAGKSADGHGETGWLYCVLEPRELPVFVRKQVPEMEPTAGRACGIG